MASSRIHPSAVIDEGARIAQDAVIGPFCHVGPEVALGAGVVLKSHVVVAGATEIGPGTTIWPFAVVGEVPQDLKYRGEATRLRIGAGTRIREHVTINIGTEGGGGLTELGDDCLLMAGAHVAHDVRIGNGVILVNHASVAGHCRIGDHVIVGGLSGVHQWVRIGRGAMIGALSMVTHDVIPNGLVQGPRAELEGLNLVGLKRRGISRVEINALRRAFDLIRAGEGSFIDRARAAGTKGDSALVDELAAFVTGETDRQFLTPR